MLAKLGVGDLGLLRDFYLGLDSDSRYRRFMMYMTDEGVERYLSKLDFSRVIVFGFFGESGLVGVCEGYIGGELMEGAFAVDSAYRNRGVGRKLLERLILEGSLNGCKTFMITCKSQNLPMVKLARRFGMEVVADGSESEAYLRLEEPDLVDRLAVASQGFFEDWGLISLRTIQSLGKVAVPGY